MLRPILAFSTALSALALLAAPATSAPRVASPAAEASPLLLAAYDPLVYRAQVALNAKGFDTGRPDGILGPRTRAALESYQRASGMPVTGTVTQALVAQLEGTRDARAERYFEGDRENPYFQDRYFERDVSRAAAGAPTGAGLIRETQAELRRHGYGIGAIDGQLDGATTDAIRSYQQAHGMEPTGMPSPELLAALRRNAPISRGISPPSHYPPAAAPVPLGPPPGVQCADWLHQSRPGGDNYKGPPVPGCD